MDVFNFPKDELVLQKFVEMATDLRDEECIVMDFFAGSGTTAHAVALQNIKDGGNRRYVLVQLPEPLNVDVAEQRAAATYCDVIGKARQLTELTKQRLRLIGARVQQECAGGNFDLGFRVFRLDNSNIRLWEPNRTDIAQSLFKHLDHIDTRRSDDDVLYELLLKLGLDLCVPVEQKAIAGKTVSSVGGGVLLACLDKQITAADAEPLALGIIAWHKALGTAGDVTCVFRDSAFVDDVAKTNLAAILEQYGIAKVRSL